MLLATKPSTLPSPLLVCPELALCAGMAAASLQPLLEGAGLDALLSHVLPLLSLHDLGRLCASCRRLRTVVSTAPAAVWQASANRSQPHPQHPVHSAVSCQAYLRQQHATHAAISSRRSVVTTMSSSPGNHSPDLSAYATLLSEAVGSHSLQLLDLATLRETASIKLPALDYARWLFWDRTSDRVALPWGSTWRDNVVPAVPTGLCIVHAQSGELTQIDLGLESDRVIFGGFTPDGSVIIRHALAAELVWTLFDATGAPQVSTTSCFSGDADSEVERMALAPDGARAATFMGPSDFDCIFFALWQPSTGSTLSVETGDIVRGVSWSPCSQFLLCRGWSNVTIWDTQGVQLSTTDMHAQCYHASWVGNMIAVFCRDIYDAGSDAGSDSAEEETCLRVFTVQDQTLTFCFRYELPGSSETPGEWELGDPVVSPDWQHIAVMAYNVRGTELGRGSQLLVLSTAGGRLCSRTSVTGHFPGVHWCPQGDAVACSTNSSVLIRFW